MSLTESSQRVAKNRNRRVMAFGTFDLFHPGHEYYLREAGTYGDTLFIVIARDKRVISGKGRTPIDNEEKRRNNVEYAFPYARVILGDADDIFAPIREHHPDILAFGYDQRAPVEQIRELFPTLEMVRVGGYETGKWKSSKLRKMIPSPNSP